MREIMIDPARHCTLPERLTFPTIRCTVAEAEPTVAVPVSKLHRLVAIAKTYGSVDPCPLLDAWIESVWPEAERKKT